METDLSQIFSIATTQCLDSTITSMKQALERVSTLVSKQTDALSEQAILHAIRKREKLGSTLLGNGIALPHGRLDDLAHPVGAILTLEAPIRVTDSEQQGIDIVIALFVETNASNEHLNLLATLVKHLQKKDVIQKIRMANDKETLFKALTVGTI